MKKSNNSISDLLLIFLIGVPLVIYNKNFLYENLNILENLHLFFILTSIAVIFIVIKLISVYKYLDSLFDTFSKFSSEKSNKKDLVKEEVKEGHFETFYTNGNLKFIGNYFRGKLDGATKDFFDNGQIKETGNFKEGKKDGVFILFDESGIKKERLIFDRGILCEKRLFTNKPLDGIRNFYDWDGRLLGSISCENEIQGTFDIYYENGQLKVKGTYNNGTRNKDLFYESGFLLFKESISKSTWLSYYENGQIKAKGIFVAMIDIDDENLSSENLFGDTYFENLRKIGIWEYYHENGNLKSNINYDESNFVSFYEDGCLEIRGKYENSRKVDFWEYFDEYENIQSKGNYNSDSKEGYWEYYHEDGNLQSKGKYDNDWKVGYWEDYYENEQLESKGNYDIDVQVGYWEYYHENGQLQSKGDFCEEPINGDSTQIGYWEYYHENGQLKAKGNYYEDPMDGGSSHTGYWEYYHENGQLQSTGNYENGVKIGFWENYHESGKKINTFGKFFYRIKTLFIFTKKKNNDN